MSLQQRPESWLLIERASEASRWVRGAAGAARRLPATWFWQEGTDLSQLTGYTPYALDLEKAFVCLMVVPDDGTFDFDLAACDVLVRTRAGRRRLLGGWCHYGGNVVLGRVADRWRGWSGLGEASRARVQSLLVDPGYPLPFSSGQILPWHAAFEELRLVISEWSSSPRLEALEFERATHLIGCAWYSANPVSGKAQEIDALRGLCEVALAAAAVWKRMEDLGVARRAHPRSDCAGDVRQVTSWLEEVEITTWPSCLPAALVDPRSGGMGYAYHPGFERLLRHILGIGFHASTLNRFLGAASGGPSRDEAWAAVRRVWQSLRRIPAEYLRLAARLDGMSADGRSPRRISRAERS